MQKAINFVLLEWVMLSLSDALKPKTTVIFSSTDRQEVERQKTKEELAHPARCYCVGVEE